MSNPTKLAALVVTGCALLATATPAFADVAGRYDVKFEDVSTNCTTQKLAYKPSAMDVKEQGTSVTIDLDLTPLMQGSSQRNGKLSAKSKPGNTMIDGMQGVFSVAGKVAADGSIQLVMVAEYSKAGKALCSQSWTVSGTRSTAGAPTKPKTGAGTTQQIQQAHLTLDEVINGAEPLTTD